MSARELSRRLAQGRSELAEAPWYDFIVVNDILDDALAQLQAIVQAHRCRTSFLWPRLAARFGF
jgi:guanylate kinase